MQHRGVNCLRAPVFRGGADVDMKLNGNGSSSAGAAPGM